MVLIGISRKFFTHSLPLSATEECYLWLEDCVRNTIATETNPKKEEKEYQLLIRIKEDYNSKILSTKVYWDNFEEKEEYKVFWNKYNEILKIQDKLELEKQKTILFLKDDLKKLYKTKGKNKKIISKHKKYLVMLGGMKNLKNTCKSMTNILKGEKQV